MISELSAPVRKLLAVGLLLALLLAAEALLLSPWRDWRAGLDQRIATTALLLARTQAAAAAPVEAPPAPTAGLLLAAADDALAAAELQTLLGAAAAAEGVQLATLQVEPATALPGARRIALRVTLSAPFAPLLRLMNRLESGRPVVRLEAVEIQATSAGEDPELSASLSLAALRTAP
jgi:hypothetical protein